MSLVHKKFILIGLGAVAIGVAAVPSVYFYTQYRRAQEELSNPAAAAQAQSQQVIAQVGKLMLLPTDETPTVATVTDREKLQNQPFFANAANGDKVLIYSKSKKAILFRPDRNLIIDVAPVNFTSSASANLTNATSLTTPGITPAPVEIKIALRNGTSTVGLTKTYETALAVKLPGASVVDRDNAAARDYTKTYVYDLTGKKADEAATIAKTLNISVGQLPKTEDVTQISGKADFLIIIGLDQK